MKFIKSFVRAALGAALVLGAINAHAQIPTTDVAALAQRLTQITNEISQLEQMKAQVASLTGNSSVGTILNNPALHTYLPDQWDSIYSQIKSGQLSGLSSATQTIMQQEGLANAPTAGQQHINDTLAANKAMAQQAYDQSIQRLTNIQNLMMQSNTTMSAADKADLNNRLQAESAMIQNEQTRLNMMTTLQNAETEMAKQQAQTTFKNSLLGLDANGNPVSQ